MLSNIISTYNNSVYSKTAKILYQNFILWTVFDAHCGTKYFKTFKVFEESNKNIWQMYCKLTIKQFFIILQIPKASRYTRKLQFFTQTT